MYCKKRNQYEVQAKIIKALAHPSRLYIVDELSNGEKCVCELTQMIGFDMSTVSKHLTILKNAGIIQDEKRGTNIYYKLKMPCVLKFFDCVQSVITTLAKENIKIANRITCCSKRNISDKE